METMSTYAKQAAQAVTDFRSGTNPHWNDTYLNMGAQLMQQMYENDQQRELWDLMNEYNSPVNQMQRFKDAGLNPMLAYTQGTPGNANSAPGYTSAKYQLSPRNDKMRIADQVLNVFNVVSNLAQNVAGMLGTGYDLQLKKNQLTRDNIDTNLAVKYLSPGSQLERSGSQDGSFVLRRMNPFAVDFDPYMFLTFQKQGHLPQLYNSFMDSVQQRATSASSEQLNKFKSKYQDYYNQNLLPLFKSFQEGRINMQDLDYEMKKYNKDVLEMIPSELRGILEPIVNYLGPFIKFMFKKSVIQKQ